GAGGGRGRADVAERGRVVLGELDQGVGGDVVQPHLGVVGGVAGVLVHQHPALAVHGDVVEHVLALGPVEDGLDGPAGGRVRQVGEVQPPEPAAADLGADAVADG